VPYREPNDQDTGGLLIGTRLCKSCEVTKSITEFHWANNYRHRRRICKSCTEARRLVLRAADPEKYKRIDKFRALRLKYGVTEQDFLVLWNAQDGLCAICFEPLEKFSTPHLDHNHVSGVVRGLLCFTCNTALGKFHDSVVLLRSAIVYLEKDAA